MICLAAETAADAALAMMLLAVSVLRFNGIGEGGAGPDAAAGADRVWAIACSRTGEMPTAGPPDDIHNTSWPSRFLQTKQGKIQQSRDAMVVRE